MQLGDRRRIHPLAQSLAEKSPEQVVEAKELVVAIERDQEEVEALDLDEKRMSPCIRFTPVDIIAADGLAERGAKPVEDRHSEEALLRLGRLTGEDLLEEERSDIPDATLVQDARLNVVAGEEGHEVQAGRPAFRFIVQAGDVVVLEVIVERLAQECRGLLGGEPEVVEAQLGQPATRA